MTAYTPNLPALITALPSDHTRAPQESNAAASTPSGCCPQCAAALPGAEPVPTYAEGRLFDRARQVLFLENLSVTGSVRSAASAARVSHQTAYRARRSTPAFRTAWDAALVVARANAADVLACRAIDGVEEKVFYHGEEVATRTRYSDRLLLAHLARLDRLAETPQAGAFAEDFDEALAAFGRGEDFVASTPPTPPAAGAAAGPENFSPGPCNTRSMSYTSDEDVADENGIDWDDEEAAEAELARIEAAMAAARPPDAPPLTGIGPDGVERDPDGAIEAAQWEAFARGVARWWLVVPPFPPPGSDDWRYAGPDSAPPPGPKRRRARKPAAKGGARGGADCKAKARPASTSALERGAGTAPEAAPDTTPAVRWRDPFLPVDHSDRMAPSIRLI